MNISSKRFLKVINFLNFKELNVIKYYYYAIIYAWCLIIKLRVFKHLTTFTFQLEVAITIENVNAMKKVYIRKYSYDFKNCNSFFHKCGSKFRIHIWKIWEALSPLRINASIGNQSFWMRAFIKLHARVLKNNTLILFDCSLYCWLKIQSIDRRV